MADYSTYYATDPWTNVASNQRTWYDPTLRATYRRDTVFTGMVPYATQPMLPRRAATMVFNYAFDYPTNTDPAPTLRYNETAPAYLDGQQVEVTFQRYQWQTAYDKAEELITYWEQEGYSEAGLLPLIRERVSRVLNETTDLLIRNAFLSTSYITLGNAAYTGADQLTTSDKFTLDMVDLGIVRAQTQNVWSSAAPGLQKGDLLCIGTPGQHYDVISSNAATNRWIELRKYAGDVAPFNSYELGSYHSSRHLFTNANVLWNCGPSLVTTTIKAAASPLDGSPDPASTKVDGVYKVGQPSTNAVHYIDVTSAAGFSVGDIVSIHKKKVQSTDHTARPKITVTGSPVFDEGSKIERRIVAIDGTHVSFNKPLMLDYSAELNATGTGAAQGSTGVYGFMSKALNLHANIMIAEPNGIVCGVSVPPRIYAPAPIDLYQSVFRVGWDAFWKFQLVRPEAFEVFITVGTMREKAQTYV